MTENPEYLGNYLSDHLYIIPAAQGAFAKLVSEGEVLIGEVEITARMRIAVVAFYTSRKGDFDSFRIISLKFHQTHGWRTVGEVHVNHAGAERLKAFITLISGLDLENPSKARISLNQTTIQLIGSMFSGAEGAALLAELSENSDLKSDIYAIANKRRVLDEFENNLASDFTEPQWQAFFERNSWIFGHGLNYVFMDGVSKKLESTTTGSTFDQPGKRVDALLKTRAEVSQFVLVEIKRHSTDLLQQIEYRSGCYGVSKELSDAVTQIQKTTFDFSRERFRQFLKDDSGNDLAQSVYSVEPDSYLVIGNLDQIRGNDDKITCFELYRRKISSPRILTFDELFWRARCIVENISSKSD